MTNAANYCVPRTNLHALRVALRYPDIAVSFILRRRSFDEAFQAMVARDLVFLRRRHSRVMRECEAWLQMPEEEQKETLRQLSLTRRENTGRMVANQWYSFLYAATRSLRPEVVVETGVFYGQSSAAILQALQDIGKGTLLSIDLPPSEHKNVIAEGRSVQIGLPSARGMVGLGVPLSLRPRWDLRLGNSLDILPKVLAELAPISMFVHDSLHTYEHMTAEYALAYEALAPEGLLVSDDIDYNSAWSDFCRANNEHGVTLSKGTEGHLFAYLNKST